MVKAIDNKPTLDGSALKDLSLEKTRVEKLWLAKLSFDTRVRQARNDLSVMSDLHRTVMRLAPEGLGESPRAQAKLLFRCEPDSREVLVQLGCQPRPHALPDYVDCSLADASPVLSKLKVGHHVQYRCSVTPVIRKGKKETAVLDEEALRDWWSSKLISIGLDGPGPATVETDLVKVNDRRRMHITRFDGESLVVDPAIVLFALVNGVGRNKNWGAGLLSMALKR